MVIDVTVCGRYGGVRTASGMNTDPFQAPNPNCPFSGADVHRATPEPGMAAATVES
jgi:hypothetical protein